MKNKHNRPESSFDTPLRVVSDDAGYIVYSKSNDIVCQNSFYVDAKRMARMPELYDALANAVRNACQDCVDQVYDHPTDYDPVKHGCLFKDKSCCEMCRSWIELLRKVRDGE